VDGALFFLWTRARITQHSTARASHAKRKNLSPFKTPLIDLFTINPLQNTTARTPARRARYTAAAAAPSGNEPMLDVAAVAELIASRTGSPEGDEGALS
jgi:hypothetical protein